jgi:hypothetical protein
MTYTLDTQTVYSKEGATGTHHAAGKNNYQHPFLLLLWVGNGATDYHLIAHQTAKA